MLLIVPQEKNQDTQQGLLKFVAYVHMDVFFGVRSNIYRPLKNDPVIIDNENFYRFMCDLARTVSHGGHILYVYS